MSISIPPANSVHCVRRSPQRVVSTYDYLYASGVPNQEVRGQLPMAVCEQGIAALKLEIARCAVWGGASAIRFPERGQNGCSGPSPIAPPAHLVPQLHDDPLAGLAGIVLHQLVTDFGTALPDGPGRQFQHAVGLPTESS